MKWKILESSWLFNDLWFKVRKDKCETPSGKIIDPYYVYEFPTWVAAVAVREDGKIILEKQYRHALGEVCIELPGGCVDPEDKDPEAGIRRELMEETGYSFSSYTYLGRISANPSTNTNLLHMYLATGGTLSGKQDLDPNEEIELLYVDLAELKQLLKENKIVQSMHVSCILYALSHLNEIRY